MRNLNGCGNYIDSASPCPFVNRLFDDAEKTGTIHRVPAVGGTELVEQMLQVPFDGFGADIEQTGDFLVRAAGGKGNQHFHFAVGQLTRALAGRTDNRASTPSPQRRAARSRNEFETLPKRATREFKSAGNRSAAKSQSSATARTNPKDSARPMASTRDEDDAVSASS